MKAQYQLIFCTLLACGLAAPVHAFDLVDAVRAARDYDANYAGSRATLAAGQEKAVQGRALLLPSVGLAASRTRIDSTTPAADPYTNSSLGLQLSQPLFNVASYTGYKKGQISSELAQLQFNASSQQLISDVARAYFDVLLAEDVLNVTQATKKAYAHQLAQAKKAFEVGTATITDTHEAQAGYDGAQAQEISAMSDLEAKRNTLASLTNLKPEEIKHLPGKRIITNTNPGTQEQWLTRAQDNSLAFKSAQQQLLLAEQNLTAARGQHLPTVTLNAALNDSRNNDARSIASQLDRSRNNTLGINLSLPLFAGGAINSQVSEAVANLDRARDDVEAAKRKVQLDVRRGWLGVSNGAALIRAQEQLLVSAKSKLDSTTLGKEVGVRTNLDLLNAEKDYQDAVRALAQARYSFLLARLTLAQVAGTLDDELVAEINRAF